MIVSHRHRFIFIKTKKTAGTSLEIALSRFCGPEDILSPLGRPFEDQRCEASGRRAQNYTIPFYTWSGARRYDLRDWARLLVKREPVWFYNHMDALKIRRRLGESVWNDYFKFCFERNPWDKVVSYYYHQYSDPGTRPSIAEFIRSGEANNVGGPGGYDLYTIDQRIAVDRVCRYENLEEEVRGLSERLGLGEPPPLPRARSGLRPPRQHYRDLLSDDDRDEIAKAFAREIAHFGYAY